MRILMLMLATALPFTTVSAAPLAPPVRIAATVTGKACKPIAPQWARFKDNPFLRPSNEPTRFDLHQAVVRSLDGCPVPAILRQDVDDARLRNVQPDKSPTRLLTR